MSLVGELRIRARHVIAPLLAICTAGYFAYHTVHGDRGLLAYLNLKHQIEARRAELSALERQRTELEHRVRLLHPETLDPDMLEERARIMLNFGYPEDIVIIDSARDARREDTVERP
jgi:cell division protein FtsB